MKAFLSIFFICSVYFLAAQSAGPDSTSRSYNTEIGLNITNTLAGFLNADGIDAPADPYLVSIKFVRRTNVLRLGFNLKTLNTTEEELQLRRERKELTFQGRLGFEKRVPINRRCAVHWGLDAIAEVGNTKVTTSANFGEAALNLAIWGIGGGPVLGFQFRPHPRVILSTEAALYALARFRSEQENIPPAPPNENRVTEFKLSSIVPSALYVHFAF
jgi:hypothetical protein